MQSADLAFLQVKIVTIGTALFFCDNDKLLPFSAYIITALKTDEKGNIWFFISRNWEEQVDYTLQSPAKLEFYRKGYPFSLKIGGTASIVNDRQMMHEFMQELLGKGVAVKEEAIEGMLLVRVQIETADYKELTSKRPQRSFVNPLAGLKRLFQHHQGPSINWQPAT